MDKSDTSYDFEIDSGLETSLRVFKTDSLSHTLYRNMYKNQTIEFVKQKKSDYSKLNRKEMTIKMALSLLDNFIDPSDPDLDIENSVHAYQTAERIRKKYPDNKEFQLIGLIHDIGKVLYYFNEPSWAVVGDTYVLGCAFPKSIVYYDTLKEVSPNTNTNTGIYNEKCGLDNLILSYGHDEYLYMVLKGNSNHCISDKYMDVIRYHSFYPWHTNNEYRQFMNDKDFVTLQNVREFNNFDLYSKEDNIHITQKTKEYYNTILDEYFFGELNW
jgi:inositol oxygenase